MALSIAQKKILKLLTINCRFSNKDIAKAAGVSPDTVNYQIEKLVEKDKFGSFAVQFDYRLLGFDHFHFLARVKDPDTIPMADLKAIKGVTFINTAHGKYDIQLIIIARDEKDLEKQLNKVHTAFGKSIIDFTLLKFQSQFKYTYLVPNLYVSVTKPKKPKSVVYSLARENFCEGFTDKRIELDKVDYAIIKGLLHNPRINYLELARKAGVSHETVRNRIANYVKKHFITTFGMWNDHAKHGFFSNFLLMKVKDFNESSFKAFLDQKKYVFYSAKLIGDYNLILYMFSRTPDEFGEQTKEIRRYFKDRLLLMELFYFDKLVKNVQFPEALLE